MQNNAVGDVIHFLFHMLTLTKTIEITLFVCMSHPQTFDYSLIFHMRVHLGKRNCSQKISWSSVKGKGNLCRQHIFLGTLYVSLKNQDLTLTVNICMKIPKQYKVI